MAYPGVAQDPTLTQTLYRLQFALGGPGFSVPFGLLIAGVSITAGFTKLEVGRHSRSRACSCRRTELARHPVSEGTFPDPADPVSGFYLDDCHRLRTAQPT
jgi:hypothetical protein